MRLDPDVFAPVTIPEDKDDLDRAFATIQTWGDRLRTLIVQDLWVPLDKSGALLVFTYTRPSLFAKVGPLVYFSLEVTYPTTADTSGALIGFTPYANDNAPAAVNLADTNYTTAMMMFLAANDKSIYFYKLSGAQLTNADLSGKTIRASCVYRTPE